MSNVLAQMLDELMGRDRNLAPTEKRSETKWDDPDVCKYFLVDFCPSELFVNTRADLGPCDKIHDDHLRKDYKKSSRCERMGYEENFLRYLQGLINDVEKRIRRGHQRLALNSMQGSLNGNPMSQKDEKIQMLTDRINDLVQQATDSEGLKTESRSFIYVWAEELGCEGKVEEAQGIMKLCDQLNEERTQLQNQPNTDQFNEPLKAMEVCTVCGALLVVGDAQQRVEEHIMGKQHSGYARIRAFVESKLKKAKETDEEREAKLKQEREEREKEREKEREERKKKEEERKKEKEREREERKKERESRREKDSDRKKRSRSRSRSRRSRSRDRKRRSRSRERRRHSSRSRSRDRHRSRRHRSRSRSKRSRSRERRSSRSRDKDRKSRQKSSEKSGSRDKEKEQNETDGVSHPAEGAAEHVSETGAADELEPGETH